MARYIWLSVLIMVFGYGMVAPITMPIKQVNAQADNNPYGVTLNSKDVNSQTNTSSQWIKNTGMTWIRETELFKKIEASPGVFDWKQADSQVQMTLSHGLKVDWVLMQAPDWAVQPGCTQVPQAKAFANFAATVFKRYETKLSSIEIGNEEWSFDSVAACKTPQNYASVYNPVHDVLRKAGYIGLIGTFGYTHYRSVSEISAWWQAFAKLASSEDYGNFHFYHDGKDPNVALTGKPAFMQVVNAIFNAIHEPLWVTEYGYATCCRPANLVTPAEQSQYEHEILEDGRLSKGKLTHAFVYTLMPENDGMSLYLNGQPLPAAHMEAKEAAMFPHWR